MAADPGQVSPTGTDIEAVVPESEEAVEAEQMSDEPAEAPDEVADEDMVEEEGVADESFTDGIVTTQAEAPVEKNASEEAEAEESAPMAAMPAEELSEAAGAPAAEADDGQADLPSSGEGEPEDAPGPGILKTEVANRAALTATDTVTSKPTLTAPAVPPEEVVAEAPREVVAEEPEALPIQGEPAGSQAVGSGLPLLRVVILLLGIVLILLAGITLITRRQLNG